MMFLYIGIISAFIQTYPAIRREIPSFKILLLIHSCNRKNIEINDNIIIENLSKFNSLESKINELLQDGFVISNNNSLVLTKSGLILATFFKIYRKLLGLENGKG
jgi:predicted transcriptional regulator